MRQFFILFLLLIFGGIALPLLAKTQGKDPFYPTQSNQKKLNIKLPKFINLHYCPQAKAGFLANISFEQLKIVGVVKNKQSYKLLVMDENQRFLELKKGDFVALERLQLIDIQLGLITLKHWDYAVGCEQSQLTRLQF